MANGTTTYAFGELTGVIGSPLAGPFVLAGLNLGAGKITVTMTGEWTEHNVAPESAVMVSVVPSRNGECEIECQQTSALHEYLKVAQNAHQGAVLNHDATNWAGLVIELLNPQNGSQHLLRGVSFTKSPTVPFGPHGEMLVWKLKAATIINL